MTATNSKTPPKEKNPKLQMLNHMHILPFGDDRVPFEGLLDGLDVED
jgi:hypothetical protein